MKIYVVHSKKIDYRKELYEPIRKSPLNERYDFIFPHEESDRPFDSRKFLEGGCDLVIAEVSGPSTGMGIELGWTNMFNIPVACIYKKGLEPSGSLCAVSDIFEDYSDGEELVLKIEKILLKK